MPLFRNKWYVHDDLIEDLRNRFLDSLDKESHKYHPDDIKRVKENDWYIGRYLLHTDKDLDKAYNMLTESLKFRKEMEVNDLRKKDLPLEYFDVRAVIPCNKDKRGNPIVAIRCKTHIKREDTRRLQQQYLLYWVERAQRTNNWGSVTVLFDCTDAGVSNMDLDMIRFQFEIFKKYIPWGIGNFLVYNMPWYLSAFWKIIKGWIPQKHVEIICFVDSTSIKKYVDEDQIPKALGGTSSKLYEPVEGVTDEDENE